MRDPDPPRLQAWALAGMLAAATAGLAWGDVLGRFDRLVWDVGLTFWERRPPADVAIVAIDDKSLSRLGQWPWSRRRHAALLDRLAEAGTAVVGLDIVFAEADADDPAADAALAAALRRHGRVVLPVHPDQPEQDAPLTEVLPVPPLASAAAALGHVHVVTDPDGIARGLCLRAGLGGPRWPSFAVAVRDLAAGDRAGAPPPSRSPSVPAITATLPEPAPSEPLLPSTGPSAGEGRFAWRCAGQPVLVPFAGPPGHFPAVSFVDVLGGTVAPARLRGKLVLVGATAPGLGDALPTPVGRATFAMPGVELNANVLTALREGRLVRPLGPGTAALATAAFVLLVTHLQRLRPAGLGLLGGLLAWLAVVLLLPHRFGLWLPPVPALLGLLAAAPAWAAILALRRRWAERRRAQVTLDSIGEGVIVAGPEGCVDYLNPAAERLTGWPAGRARGRPLAEVLPLAGAGEPSDRERPAGEGAIRPFPASDGTLRHVRVAQGPVHGPGGEALGTVLVIGDVTAAVAAEAALQASERRRRRLEAELEDAARTSAVAQVSAAIAHEINQPLAALRAYADTSRHLAADLDGPTAGTLREALAKLGRQAERAGEVVRRLRALFEQGRGECVPHDLDAAVGEAIELALAGHRGAGRPEVELRWQPAGDLPSVPIDRVQIQQVVVNLVRNALEAMAGSPVRRLTVRTTRGEDDTVELSVADSGPGLDPAIQDALFRPLATTKPGGMGIGLAICRAIVEAHGGAIRAGTGPDGGAEFRVTLPVGADGRLAADGRLEAEEPAAAERALANPEPHGLESPHARAPADLRRR